MSEWARGGVYIGRGALVPHLCDLSQVSSPPLREGVQQWEE